MPVELLSGPQSDVLADGGKVITGGTIVGTPPIVRHEEGLRTTAQKPVALLGIADEPNRSARRYRNDARLAGFATTDGQHADRQIDIAIVEADCLADPKAGDANEAEEHCVCHRAHPI